MTGGDKEPRRWHQALAYALLGRRLEDLGTQRAPDLDALTKRLEPKAAELLATAQSRVEAGLVWPYPVPGDLMAGLGFAQFAAALQMLRRRLGLEGVALSAPRVGQTQPPDAGQRRLLEDVPPHHGS